MTTKTDYSRLYEGIDLSQYAPEQIMNSKKLYDYIVESAEIAKEEGKSLDDVVDEGIFSALVGVAAGATVGPSIMKAVCKVLGIQETGTLGNLLTSRVVLAAVCGELGLSF
jgi:hypothetical protein